ncbi:MAG: phosphodiester glycosidase family protein, partial [Lachnospiraceae bacterium]|nr:phosphodiester glycosidase family protein [Lachnospiraceae bacterium]
MNLQAKFNKFNFACIHCPRTAIGTDRKGKVYLVVVDGRSAGNADGVTIAELTKICEWLGLRDA